MGSQGLSVFSVCTQTGSHGHTHRNTCLNTSDDSRHFHKSGGRTKHLYDHRLEKMFSFLQQHNMKRNSPEICWHLANREVFITSSDNVSALFLPRDSAFVSLNGLARSGRHLQSLELTQRQFWAECLGSCLFLFVCGQMMLTWSAQLCETFTELYWHVSPNILLQSVCQS